MFAVANALSIAGVEDGDAEPATVLMFQCGQFGLGIACVGSAQHARIQGHHGSTRQGSLQQVSTIHGVTFASDAQRARWPHPSVACGPRAGKLGAKPGQSGRYAPFGFDAPPSIGSCHARALMA